MKVWVLSCVTYDPDNNGCVGVYASRELAMAEMLRVYTEEAEDDDEADYASDLIEYGDGNAKASYTNLNDEDFAWIVEQHDVEGI